MIPGFGRGERDVESGVSFVVLKLKPCERGGGEGEGYGDLTYVMLCYVVSWYGDLEEDSK